MTDAETLDRARLLFVGDTQGDRLAREVIQIAERAAKKAALWEETLDERSAQQHACEGFEGQCDSQQAEKRAAMTAYHWDGTGPDPNRPRWLCKECWLGYRAHWTEMWAEAGYGTRDQTTNKGV